MPVKKLYHLKEDSRIPIKEDYEPIKLVYHKDTDLIGMVYCDNNSNFYSPAFKELIEFYYWEN